MSYYNSGAPGGVASITDATKLNNQVIISNEANPALILDQGVFCLEFLKALDAETVTIVDGNGTAVLTDVANINQEHSPLMLNNGFTVTGNVTLLKGFTVTGLSSRVM